MSIRNLRLLFALAAVMTASALAQTNTRTSEFAFPLVGLASTETIGVNLINLASTPTNSSATAASCTGSVSFINATTGATIGTATSFTLAANAATSATLAFSSTGLASPRGLVRAVVSQTLAPGVPCQLSASLNTYDTTTGVTHVFLTATGAQSGPGFGH
jgi:hypothetical protein